jgi:hypothetical protein
VHSSRLAPTSPNGEPLGYNMADHNWFTCIPHIMIEWIINNEMDFDNVIANVMKSPFFLKFVNRVYPIQVYSYKYSLLVDMTALQLI